MKRKGSIRYLFSSKGKVRDIENEQLNRVDGEDEAEGERERQQKPIEYKAKVTSKDSQMLQFSPMIKKNKKSVVLLSMKHFHHISLHELPPLRRPRVCLISTMNRRGR